ncbi:putative RNA recognition motif domain, nucleotide-binding alpha-beta plait domain superfamily [Helianthus annuus]|nr:putative RNA recognition motif domain, nucleotide-binding alpha-beta plait domain superfamily [Helianthus annuus]KAJ0474275.1 putative RNA recognition motif domain, nucleotide-binding alpha-beta plait domain superfamily [Helianthus annuus]KAJ0649842.1 putative RNA recognition motif domain, nucleotide-binding alpha-beta plait domain superfamily [Helianthus annuus]KAJ0653626.1 putative RNA recognition motif domain, nucleotide-binding alpha-beta plait domain superfamily [Helianthus annuus]
MLLPFYISNLPAGCCTMRLWMAFESWPQLEYAFMPRKRDGAGKFFGFVGFSGVSDVEQLLESFKDMSIDEACVFCECCEV